MTKQLKELLAGQKRIMAMISDSYSCKGNITITEQLEEPLRTMREFKYFEGLLSKEK